MEKKILQDVENKIITLKHSGKVHKTNPVLKQEAVIEYLYELHEKYVLFPIDKAANNIAGIGSKSVTIPLIHYYFERNWNFRRWKWYV